MSMNETDVAEIEGLLRTATKMKELAANASRLYKNPKMAEYAKAAIKDFNELKAYIIQKIDENLELFLNLKKVHLSSHPFDDGYIAIRDHKPVVIRLNDMLEISFYVNPTRKLSIERGNAGGYEVELLRDEVELKDVWVYTSDTSKPEYGLVSGYGFWKATPNKDLNVPKYLDTAQSGAWWEQAKQMSDRTKRYGELLWSQFKKCILAKTAQYKGTADNANATKQRVEEMTKTLVYVAIRKD